MSHTKGFTLIEILIVLLIISITVTFTFIAFGDFGAGRKAEIQAEEFVQLIKVVEERALLEGATFGLSIDSNGYQVFRFDARRGWLRITKVPLEPRNFDKNVRVSLAVVSRDRPQIIIHPSGDMTQFQIFFGTRDKLKIMMITGKHNGNVLLHRVQND